MKHIEELYKLYLESRIVITDSRKIEPGCLFFALKGERFNGNKYAKEAIDKGAAFAVIDEAEYKINDQFILVENVLETLQALATFHRRQFLTPIIAITGSNGKTTTKELISAVLASHYKCHFTKGNFNNHIGVPLTLLDMPSDTEVAIIEMGANHQGEIDFLCKITEPTHGLITNIGKAHLEGFGGIEGVKKGKSELYKYLAKNKGVAFINQDEQFLEGLSKNIKWKIFYKKGKTPSSDKIPFEIQLLSKKPFIKAAFISAPDSPIIIESNLIGQYNFNNIMTAVALGIYFKVPDHKIKKAVENYVPTNNRSQVIKKGSNTFILDAYNANPTSMKNALHSFEKMDAKNKIAILGAMKEMGKYSEKEHQQLIKLAQSCGLKKIILVGNEYLPTTQLIFKNIEELKNRCFRMIDF
ncbi:MAG: UDP-N-acetylmuramoyl-tripeptide--D-alanyl-D-alanine ligase [Bacteroidota bacterium]